MARRLRASAISAAVAVSVITPLDSRAATPESAPARVTSPAERLDSPRTLTIAAGGDILMSSAVRAAGAEAAGPGERFDFTRQFDRLTPTLDSADLSICHMELPIGRPGAPFGNIGRSPFGGNRLIAPYEVASTLAEVGFDHCSTASNHSYDARAGGIDSTLDALDAVRITHTGTARTPAEQRPAPLDVDGVAVGHVSFTRSTNNVRPTDRWRENFAASVDDVASEIDRLRAVGAEIIVVSLHLGQEMLRAPTPTDRLFATTLARSTDVDVIVHHGPHVVQPVESINRTIVFWSVGNMMSSMGVDGQGRYTDPRTLDGLLAVVEFTESDELGWIGRAKPTAICLDPITRRLSVARQMLGEITLGERERQEIERCLARTEQVVGTVH